MLPVSQAYMEAIQLHRTLGVRNMMYAEISFGLFADGAKEDSSFQISPGAPISDAGSMYWNEAPAAVSYAMWERNSFRLDGVQTFLPYNGYQPQGYISKALSDENGTFVNPPTITVIFGQHYSVVGLSFLFDKTAGLYASEMVVSAYDGDTLLEEVTSANTEGAEFKPELTLEGFDRLVIQFTKTRPRQRMRLTQLLFGIGYVYGGNDLLGHTFKRAAHPLSLSIPEHDLQFELYNEDDRYNIDAENSVVAFFQEEQEVSIRYGYDLTGMGDIEWFAAGRFYLDSWDTHGVRATFNAKGTLYRLTKSMFYKGKYFIEYSSSVPSVKTLFNSIIQDTDIEEYYCGIQTVWSTIPIPYAPHAEGLQLLANCSNSTLREYPSGKIAMQHSDLAPKSSWVVSYRPTGAGYVYLEPPFSKRESILNAPTETYATWEENLFALDGSMSFLPEDGYLDTGAALNLFPDDEGQYYYTGTTQRVGVSVALSQDTIVGTVRIGFAKSTQLTEVLVLATRFDGVAAWRKIYHEVGEMLTIRGLHDVYRITIYPLNSGAYQRLRVQSVEVSQETGLEITPADILGQPKRELLAEARNVNTTIHNVWASFENTVQMEAQVSPGVLTEIKHDRPLVNISALCDNPNVVIEHFESYAYTSFVRISGVSTAVTIKLVGGWCGFLADQFTSVPVSDTGTDVLIDNPFPYTLTMAKSQANHAAKYYRGRKQYEIEVLGYPECEPGDLILYDGAPVRVLENTITSRGGTMRGKMKLRSVADDVDTT